MVHDTAVQALLTYLAAEATSTGMVVLTEDITMALDTAAWKLEQQTDAERYAAYKADQTYRYGA